MLSKQRNVNVIPSLVESLVSAGGFLQIRKEQSAAGRFEMVGPIAMGELVTDAQADSDHAERGCIFCQKIGLSEAGLSQRVGRRDPTRRSAQAIKGLENIAFHAGRIASAATHGELYLRETSEELADVLRFYRISVECRIDAKRHHA
jgi:hypothetical protein